ncbi:MAG: sel1 repeat family protein, partial [Victivallales bacterium]|nr:sel1 repeat family protein [Victivallales bacterium]
NGKKTLQITCPSCGNACEVDGDVPVGQHLLCPYCSHKFSYSGVMEEESLPCGTQFANNIHEEITVKCPYCGAEYEVDEEVEGASCQCNVCNKNFIATKVERERVLDKRGHSCLKLSKKNITIVACALTALICVAIGVVIKCRDSTSNGRDVRSKGVINAARIVLPKWDDVVTWLRREAEQGNTDAQFTVGTIIFSRVRSEYYPRSSGEGIYRTLRSIEESRKEIEKIEDAISWYRMAAQKEDLAAITCMGVCYYWLATCTINGEIKISTDRIENIIAGKRYGFEARKYLEIAALGGNYPDALYNLGNNIYAYGNHHELDATLGGAIANRSQTCVLLLHRAAELGHTPSQRSLAYSYEHGGFDLKKDQSAADEYYEKAKKSGLAYAKGNYAFYEFSRVLGYHDVTYAAIGDAESVRRTRNKADAGDASAQYAIGECYLEGSKREEYTNLKEDHVEAVKWFRKAADQGLPVAQCKLGLCYYNGDGLKQDVSEAFKWFYKAAHQGNKDAQKYLGICYYAGLGVERDAQTAIKWLRKGVTRKSTCLTKFYGGADE